MNVSMLQFYEEEKKHTHTPTVSKIGMCFYLHMIEKLIPFQICMRSSNAEPTDRLTPIRLQDGHMSSMSLRLTANDGYHETNNIEYKQIYRILST